MKERSRSQAEKVKQERVWVLEFASTRLQPGEEIIPVRTVHRDYRMWAQKKHGVRSVLSIDSFGRLFPHIYTRRLVSLRGKQLRCVVGVKLRA